LKKVDSRQMYITGVSKLWRLYYLYEFDLSLDLVYDVMHILPLCLFKKYVCRLKEECHSRSSILEKALMEVSVHRPSDLGARWPSRIIDRLDIGKLKSTYFSYSGVYHIFYMDWDTEKKMIFVFWSLF
jgi:hypothetical protein